MSSEVEDRGASIRVTRLTAIPAGRKAYVKLETSKGITGWGEINNMVTPVACSLAESLAEIKEDEVVQDSLGVIYDEFVSLKEAEWSPVF